MNQTRDASVFNCPQCQMQMTMVCYQTHSHSSHITAIVITAATAITGKDYGCQIDSFFYSLWRRGTVAIAFGIVIATGIVVVDVKDWDWNWQHLTWSMQVCIY